MKPNKSRTYPCVVQNIIDLASQGRLREVVDCLPILARKGYVLNSKTIAFLVRKCGDAKAIKEGRWVHIHMKVTGSKHPNTFLSNHLINMYAKCGDHVKAREVFDKMRARNLYSWNNMLSGYANLGMAKAAKRLFDKMPDRDFVSWNTMVMACVNSGIFYEALRLYRELRSLGIGYNEFSFAGVLTVCVKLRELKLARQLHCQVLVVGFLSNVVLASSVLDSYAKCGELSDSWRLFTEMKERDVLAWTTLVSGFAQVGDVNYAQEIFDAMPERNSVSWNALIACYAQKGMGHRALKLFANMITHNVEPDHFSFSSCLDACTSTSFLWCGRQIHSRIVTGGIRHNIVIMSSLIDMYSKCGGIEVAKRVFVTSKNKHHVELWNTMISALANHGCGKQAMKTFVDMARCGVRPDRATFLILLKACSHSGLVQEGFKLFESMMPDYNITPDQEHYACLIDLLGRSGYYYELINLLKKMPFNPDDCVWDAFLCVCKSHGNSEFGRLLSRQLIEVEPHSGAAYLLLSGIYASLGRWDDAEDVRRLVNEALSWLDIDRKINSKLALLDYQDSLYDVKR